MMSHADEWAMKVAEKAMELRAIRTGFGDPSEWETSEPTRYLWFSFAKDIMAALDELE